jgi:hypothetical protein
MSASLMLIGGMLHLVQAFRVKTWESVFSWSLSGACYTVAGVFAFLNPMLASAVFDVADGRRIHRGRHPSDLDRIPAPAAREGWDGSRWAVVVTLLAGLSHRRRMAGQQPVDSRPVPGHRSGHAGLSPSSSSASSPRNERPFSVWSDEAIVICR